MNEIRFCLNCEKSCIIIILNIKKFFKITDSNSCKYITSIKVISVNDKIILLILIIKKNIILHYFVVNNFEKFIIFVFNDFDYSNDNLILN